MKSTWFQKLKNSLTKSSTVISEGITNIISSRKLDDEILQELEELLIKADLGVDNSISIIENLKKEKFNKDVETDEIKNFLADQIELKLEGSYSPLDIKTSKSPQTIIIVGVNGSGKTTTIAKLAYLMKNQGSRVILGAADTFRAAATQQLKMWAEKLNLDIVSLPGTKDAASVAFETIKIATENNYDIAIIDTAGRLQNRSELMDELAKIIRVLKKYEPEAPHSILLTLDATAGQNAIQQAKVFNEIAKITGLIVTKLDGSAKAGYLVSISQELEIPIHFIGIGESIEDLSDFNTKDFSRLIVGLDK